MFLQPCLSRLPFGLQLDSTWSLLGASRTQLGASWAPLGPNLALLGRSLGAGTHFGRPKVGKAGKSWLQAGSTRGFLKILFNFGPPGVHLGPSRVPPGSILDAFLVNFWSKCCPKFVQRLSQVCPKFVQRWSCGCPPSVAARCYSLQLV